MNDRARHAEHDDRRLIDRFLRSRSDADFRVLYRRHTSALYGFASRLTRGSPDAADDVVQETWFRAVDKLEGFRGESSLYTWLRAICFNVVRERRRGAASREQQLEDDAPSLHVVGGNAGRPTRLDLQRAVAALPDGYREVLLLHDVEGFTHKEIGRLAGIDEGTSKSQLSRARKTVREWLQRRGVDGYGQRQR